ncbi:FISUMP domain-containing protein [Culturomica massiliensis]|uniref:FISUMP domain-containing protein n=1 Tax=Culturomica massiliensis TaxID=1841857 RepID=UPI0008386269|nr:FISUMP domain-containing protein [Culturomica massiliensis]
MANNVRIKGDVRVLANNITNEVGKPNVATFSFTVEWDNSWRDKFNYDAVYVSLRHKYRGEGELWYPVYLQDAGNAVSSDNYTLELKNNTGTVNHNEGFFLYRKYDGTGTSTVEVTLKWDIQSTDRPNSLRIGDFRDGNVLMSAMAVEMVYIPRGAYRIGDNRAVKHFRNNYLPLLEKFDIVPYADAYFTSSVKGGPLYVDPKMAANQVNDISTDLNPETGMPTNAWYGDKVGEDERDERGYQYWSCSFARERRIKYIAISSVPGYVPSKWKLQGQTTKDARDWVDIDINGKPAGTAADWDTSLIRTYPPIKALRVNTNNTAYFNIRIYVEQVDMPGGKDGNPPLIKNVAIAEEDLKALVDNSVLIHEPQTVMGTFAGLAADDGDNWMGTTDVNYPNGYPAFYVMKYEVSQEQYVAFLNKLTLQQQRARTIGAAMDALNEGEYVFGNHRDKPSYRNGIILLKKSFSNEPMVFDVKREAGKTDPTLACNYLTAADMLAYADWSGLRPMTEMEYEKLCRPFYPTETGRGDFPWNSTDKTEATTLLQSATRYERPADGAANVNFGKNIMGPMRVGAFLSGATSRETAGMSFWGVMESGGNLSELYYSAGSEGRLFRGLSSNLHGDCYLAPNGETNIGEAYWPRHHNAFILKGGSWADTDENLLMVSNRTYCRDYYKSMDISTRDSCVTFRLGQTARQNTLKLDLVLQNGISTALVADGTMAIDTICHGDVYTISGVLPEEMRGKLYSVVWYKSENKGRTWEPIEGKGDQNLTYSKFVNINTNEDVIMEYWFKKEIYGELADAKSDPVVLRVLNTNIYLNRYTDTLDVYDHSLGVRVNVSMKAEFSWLFQGKAQHVGYDVLPDKLQKSEVGAPLYAYLTPGKSTYVVAAEFMRHCRAYDTVQVYREAEPAAQLSDAADWKCGNIMIDTRDGKRYRTVSDGRSCWMADNLNYMIVGSRCYDGEVANCDIYGRLYNWKQAVGTWGTGTNLRIQGACPAGWHVPNENEWLNLGQASTDGKSWRSQRNLWVDASQADPHIYPYTKLANNASRFSALPAGGYFFSYNATPANGSTQLKRVTGYYDLGEKAWWWCSSWKEASYINNNTSANALTYIPYYTAVDYNNTVSLVQTAGNANSIFYGPVQYLGNSTSISAESKYAAMVAIENNFYFGVRCVKD